MITPKLSDIQPVRRSFSPGDKLLCRINVDLSSDDKKKIEKTVKRFCGCDVSILFLNESKVTLFLQQKNGYKCLNTNMSTSKNLPKGKFHLDCSVFNFSANDVLYCSGEPPLQFIEDLKRWSGIEVITQPRF